ncbi:MFS transporter [Litorihabitans aurantiacus]|uniref:Major facilitator superfamily (MFS) profile domain-containing protein n=1 Tax=Litorihabitans aurantiacus TaxID=1930061 RepID=A0AA38CRA6_9MICO|nr:MFS transporter [Litorihabitans aurantiacus]GMA32768.1 hypothetical protein GCM10025875_27600 [Litorihabitans aurantiacus]
MLLSASTGVLLGVLVVHALQTLMRRPSGYGLLLAFFEAGSVIGALLMPRLRERLGTRRSLQTSAALGALATLGLAAARAPVPAAAALVLLGVATMTWNTLAVTLRQELTPATSWGVSPVRSRCSASALPPSPPRSAA